MIKPLYDKLVLEVKKTDNVSASGLVLPESDDKSNVATVLAVGPGREVDGQLQQLSVKVGDTVLFGQYAGTEAKIDGKEYLIVSEKDILGIIE